MRTEKKLQAVDAWCAWRTLQTKVSKWRLIDRNPVKGQVLINSMNQGRVRRAHRKDHASGWFMVRMAHPTDMAIVGCAVRTEKNMQAVDSWCARRTLQTWLYLNAMMLRHIRASLDGLQ